MNKMNIISCAMLSCSLLTATSAYAYDFEKDGLRYAILSQAERTVTVESYSNSNETTDFIGIGTTPSVPEARPRRALAAGYSVTIPEIVEAGGVTYTVTAISSGAFHDKVKMTSVEIPSSVVSIGASAFSNCYSLTQITNNAMTPQTITSNMFANVSRSAKLVVPAKSASVYRNADVWNEFRIESDKEVLKGDVNGDGELNVFDIVALADEILSHSGNIDTDAADVNDDGEINVFDIVSVADRILNGAK